MRAGAGYGATVPSMEADDRLATQDRHRARAVELRAARAARIRGIRRRVAASAVAMFLAVYGLVSFAGGGDATSTTSVAATTSGRAQVSSSAGTVSTADPAPTAMSSGDGATTSGDDSTSSTGSAASVSPTSAVTTQAS